MNTLWIIADCCNNTAGMADLIIKEGANDCNVLIAAIICLSLVLVTFIVAITISVWHNKELKNKATSGKGDSAEPPPQEKDNKEYIAKLISFREELSKKDSKLKDASDEACQEYIGLLSKLANIENNEK